MWSGEKTGPVRGRVTGVGSAFTPGLRSHICRFLEGDIDHIRSNFEAWFPFPTAGIPWVRCS